ncbi:MAG: DUF1624 domain-containing protein [Oscillospiraceae bacterium]|nr:DUF1624 domain-containing protein [Oscillospiraceae bacterium]
MSSRGRIWEIDALRGFLILCVIVSHSLVFSTSILGLFQLPTAIAYILQYGGALFVILSGLSCTLGTHSMQRGVMVFAGGMILTLGSYVGVLLGWLPEDMVIRFGVLHLLGFCMILSPLLKKLPNAVLVVYAAVLVVVGYWLDAQPPLVKTQFLFPLGLRAPGFTSGDYFPIAPHMGWFSLGIVLGRVIYAEKKTRFPHVSEENPFVRFFCFCGRNSLYIFILHLPIVGGVLYLISTLI